ncbi:hypothetical protein EYZ11_013048 [Aspergillus tanneri]|uniref:alpha-galactosidase n=1 Tax=Aspergillus tanneri TaxID=1220188 RepID=A0A4S3IYN0_9EURO|nr:hypothetical protein EYZ11_013048 [Aspergillus tanneri]
MTSCTCTNTPDPENGLKPYWQPRVGATWQIVLSAPIQDSSLEVDVYDRDLWINEEAIIDYYLHHKGSKVTCQDLDGWPDERWVDIRSKNTRNIMISRLDKAQRMGCDGVDPDNVDGFENESGLDLTQQDSIEFVNWLADESHSRSMSIGLKNTMPILSAVMGSIQWALNEQCIEYKECMDYTELTRSGEPIFHIEYATNQITDKEVCSFKQSENFSTIVKNAHLDEWVKSANSMTLWNL